MKALLPYLGLLVIAILIKYLVEIYVPNAFDSWKIRRKFRKGEQWRTDRELLLWLRRMNPTEFEVYIADLFTRLGYKAQAVGRSHDGGIDVIAQKDGATHYIQCKKFITQIVTLGAIRDFYGALVDHLAGGQGYFITTNEFTLEARQFAEDKPIELIDGFALIRYIKLANQNTEAIAEKQIETKNVEVCPKCSGKVIAKSGKFGKFLGCSNYPTCKYTENL